jgi:hypothetical protein
VDRNNDNELNIDASSSRLDDDAIVSLIDHLLKLDERKSEEGELKITLGLAMNHLSPRGAARLFERLIKADTYGTIDKETETSSKEEAEVALDVDQNETSDAIGNITNQLQEEVIKDEHIKCIESAIEILDISFNDIGGHGSNSANLELLSSTRRFFEHGCRGILRLPRVIVLENCGIGPAFCRSVGRVS